MLGTRHDAEDILQDAYLRWHEVAGHDIQSPIGFLITVTTRLCLDRLRQLKRERDQYGEPSSPEPIADDYVRSPEEQCEMAGEVSAAFLALLERLGADERAAFLLREVFDYDYAEVARTVGKSEAACRQLVHRALSRVRETRPRFAVSAASREHMLEKFFVAIRTGDRHAVMALLSEDVECVAHGSGRIVPALKALQRPQRVGSLHRRVHPGAFE
jgi:RNA polymerase sigma-70 factor (ECF subfamily)